ncbi:hypothetical protein LCGC14_1343930 [marine sediment metagenome]|uniref:PCI domain-containing protein n=1 Tax=marine sediment metagenome TaxID=412755 RepID=A0A0F9MTR5_9ZZZZ
MGVQKYQINIADSNVKVRVENWDLNDPKFLIDDGGGKVHFDNENFDKAIKIMEELKLISDIKENNKTIILSEYIRFHRNFISDPLKVYNYEFRISQRDRTRNSSSGVYLKGIEQLNLVKDSLINLHEKYISDRMVDEKIKAEGLKYVEYDNKKYEVKKGLLTLHRLGIKKITDIKGLEELDSIKYLGLGDNKIENIEGLDHLVHLRNLNLAKNYIKEVTGLDALVNLEELVLAENPISSLNGLEQFENLINLNLNGTLIPKEMFREAGIEDPANAQEIIKYFKNKRQKQQEYEETKEKTINYIKNASSVFEEITFSKIILKTGIDPNDVEEIVEDLIFSGDINAKIRKNGIVFIEENPLIDIALATVDVLQDIKDDTELISYYTSYIEDIFDKTEDIEEFLKSHLANEFEKIRNAWQDYKDGKINRKELIKIGIKQVGKKFVKIFIR